MKANRKDQAQQVTFTSEAEFEKAVLERLAATLPHAVHEAVHACLVKSALQAGGAAPSGRLIQNGVRQPAQGGKCDTIWKRLDVMHAGGREPTLTEVMALAASEEWNPNNARIEFYNWRRFHGYKLQAVQVERRVKQVRLQRGMKDRRVAA